MRLKRPCRADLEETIWFTHEQIGGDPTVLGCLALFAHYRRLPAEVLDLIEEHFFPDGRPVNYSIVTCLRFRVICDLLAARDRGERIDPTPAEIQAREEADRRQSEASLRTLPHGAVERWVPVRTRRTKGITGWCAEPNDLAVSKLVEGEELGVRLVQAMFRHGLADPAIVRERIPTTLVPPAAQGRALQRLAGLPGATPRDGAGPA